MVGDMEDLAREVTDELTLAEASQPAQAMLDPAIDWQFDPYEVEPYEVELRTLRDAIEVVEEHHRTDHRGNEAETNHQAGDPS